MTKIGNLKLHAMAPFRVRPVALVVLGLLLLGAAAQAAMFPRVHAADKRNYDLEHIIPESFGSWRAQAAQGLVLPDPSASRLVDKIYNATLTRAYRRADGAVIMLVIAYGGDQSDALQLHRPEVCYAANGYEVSALHFSDVRLDGFPIRLARVMTRSSRYIEPVSYWMRVGERQVTTGMDRQLAKLASGLQGIVPDGVLVRVSSRVRLPDRGADTSIHDAFIADLLKSLDPAARELLLGTEAVRSPPQAHG